MDAYTKLYRIAPLPGTDADAFETFVVEQVLPAVDMGQTRAGRIGDTTFHKDTSAAGADRYVWIVNYDGVNAGWVDTNLKQALEVLETQALPVSSTVLVRLG